MPRKRQKRSTEQAMLPFHRDGRWGGVRPGAGRPVLPERKRGCVPHRRRCRLAASRPLHVTVRLRREILRGLRSKGAYAAILRCFLAGKARFGFRLVHYSVQSSHLHLVCEVKDRVALSRGMQGLLVRLARALNRVWGRRGSVWAERYHEHVLRSPREVRNALAYVLNNLWRHMRRADVQAMDAFASGRWFDGWKGSSGPAPPGADAAVAPARTWLLRRGWRRCGLVRLDEVPQGLR